MNAKLWADTKNPFARSSFIGRAMWRETDVDVDVFDGDVITGIFQTLLLSVPPGVLGTIKWRKKKPLALASFLRWHDTGVGLIVLSSQQHAVATVWDIAGRTDLGKLRQAASAGKPCAVLVATGEPEFKPWVRLRGLVEAIDDAQKVRRLSAKEFTTAIEGLRGLLRSDALHPILRLPREDLRSLTLDICQPL
jgi:hypothetical protein